MATIAKRLELLHFKKEPEIQPRKHFPKLGNPNPDHAVKWNYRFIEIVSPGSDAVNKGTTCGERLCVDVDEMECDNGVENAGVERVTEDAGVAKEGNYDPGPQSKVCVLDVSLNAENYETKSSFRVSFNEVPSLAESDLVCAVSDPPSCRELVDTECDSDESMIENSPSIHSFSDSEIVDMDIKVDYVLYRGIFCPWCVVTFSCNGIKINGSITRGNRETLSLEKQIDDIVRIESWDVQSTKSVIVDLIISSKDASQSADACGTSGTEELEFGVVEPNWSEKWDKIKSLNMKYLAVWSGIHDFHEAFEDIIYPKGDPDAISLSKRDVDLLQPKTSINDTIIDFYIKYLQNQIPSEEKPRFHFFNSFFFRKLTDKYPSSASDGKAAFSRIRKWTRNVDIFGTDYIFIPVNFNHHWSLLVFCYLGEVAGLKDEDAGKLLRVPCILHMNSVRGTHTLHKNLVQRTKDYLTNDWDASFVDNIAFLSTSEASQSFIPAFVTLIPLHYSGAIHFLLAEFILHPLCYLWEEWKERQKETSEELSSKFLNLQLVSPKLPQQDNSNDCGLFLLHYLELFLKEALEDLSPCFSNFLNEDWFDPAEPSVKRVRIQTLIFKVLRNHSQEVSSKSSDAAEHDFPESNQKESGGDFVSGRCAPSLANQRNLLSSESARGIETTLLEASSSMRDAQCVNGPGLVRFGQLQVFTDSVSGGDEDNIEMPDSFETSIGVHSIKMNGTSDTSRGVGCLRLRGLENLGNTCFMNSAIQCLGYTPKLVDYFLGDYKEDINYENKLGTKGELALAFGDLLRELSIPVANDVAPRKFKETLATTAPQFSGYSQHDAQEFLNFLLAGLHEDLNRVKLKPYKEVKDADGPPHEEVAEEDWQNHLACNNSIISDLCQGQYRSTLVCSACKTSSVSFDQFMCLSLELPSTTTRLLNSSPEVFKPQFLSRRSEESVTLYGCLEAFLKEETLEPEEWWHCPNCKKHQQTSKKLDLWRLPEVLVLHLKRFSFIQCGNKLENFVDFPVDDLDLSRYITHKESPVSNRYVLYGISNHFGDLASGHYTAFVHGGNKWYECNDSVVTPISKDVIRTAAAYLLFYKRVAA